MSVIPPCEVGWIKLLVAPAQVSNNKTVCVPYHSCLNLVCWHRQQHFCCNAYFPHTCCYVPCAAECRFANKGLGYQEKAVLRQKVEDAKARGEAPPDEPGMQEILAEMKGADSAADLPTAKY